jgi:hypothetical protein
MIFKGGSAYSPKAIFEEVLAENLLKYSGLSYALSSCDLLSRGKYSKPLSVELAMREREESLGKPT